MREVRWLFVAVLASLVSVTQCADISWKTTPSSPSPGIDVEEDLGVVEEQLCGDVVNTERVHVPAFTDQHHRLLQLYVRTNLQVRAL